MDTVDLGSRKKGEWTKEYRKDYNTGYYARNKEKIIATLLSKVTCALCGRETCRSNLKKHMLTKLCRNNRPSKGKYIVSKVYEDDWPEEIETLFVNEYGDCHVMNY